MNTYFKTSLLASASAFALVAMSISPAGAFDRVNWVWNAEIEETIEKNVEIDIELEPSGMIMLEDLQVSIGDITATSTVTGIENNQPQQGGVVDLGEQEITFQYGIGGNLLDNGNQSPSVVAANVNETDQQPNINGTVTATIDLGEVEVPPTEEFDALTELPEVVSAATAVANNTSITSDSSLQLHEGQFAFGDGGEINGELGQGGENGIENTNLAILAGLIGNVDSAQISATSSVSDILNASVDSTATAVANNLTVSLEPAGTDNSLMIADVVQFSYADVSATSRVRDVSLNSYTNLGALDRPIVSSVATAVGNNKSISVSAPVVAAPTP